MTKFRVLIYIEKNSTWYVLKIKLVFWWVFILNLYCTFQSHTHNNSITVYMWEPATLKSCFSNSNSSGVIWDPLLYSIKVIIFSNIIILASLRSQKFKVCHQSVIKITHMSRYLFERFFWTNEFKFQFSWCNFLKMFQNWS